MLHHDKLIFVSAKVNEAYAPVLGQERLAFDTAAELAESWLHEHIQTVSYWRTPAFPPVHSLPTLVSQAW